MNIVNEYKLKDFITNIQNSVCGINSKDLKNNEELISIFNEAARNDNDGNDKVYSCDANKYKDLVLKGIELVKKIFGIKDEDIEAKLQEHCKKLDSMLDEYKETYNKSENKSSRKIFKMREKINKEIEKIPYTHEDLYKSYIRKIRGEILEDTQYVEDEQKNKEDGLDKMLSNLQTIVNYQKQQNSIDNTLSSMDKIEKWVEYHTTKSVPAMDELHAVLNSLREKVSSDDPQTVQKAKQLYNKLAEYYPAAVEN